jgi:hypothetical protein
MGLVWQTDKRFNATPATKVKASATTQSAANRSQTLRQGRSDHADAASQTTPPAAERRNERPRARVVTAVATQTEKHRAEGIVTGDPVADAGVVYPLLSFDQQLNA